MAGVKGKSGPPGHVKRLQGGWSYWLKHKTLPPGPHFKVIKKFTDVMRLGLIQDLGGTENMTMQQKMLVDNTMFAQTVIMLASADTKEHGAVLPDGEVRPVLKMLATYLNVVRQNLVALGLKGLGDGERRFGKWLDTHGKEIKQ